MICFAALTASVQLLVSKPRFANNAKRTRAGRTSTASTGPTSADSQPKKSAAVLPVRVSNNSNVTSRVENDILTPLQTCITELSRFLEAREPFNLITKRKETAFLIS